MGEAAGRTHATSRFPIFLIAIGLVLVGLWGTHRYFYNRSLALSDAILASYARRHTEVIPSI